MGPESQVSDVIFFQVIAKEHKTEQQAAVIFSPGDDRVCELPVVPLCELTGLGLVCFVTVELSARYGDFSCLLIVEGVSGI